MDKYLQRLKELIEILKKENLAEISIEDGKFKVSIKRNLSNPVPGLTPLNMPINGEIIAPQQMINRDVPEELNLQAGYQEINSPLVGVVRLNRSDGTPYIREGSEVRKGQTVCVIEAMKVLNEITSQVSGKVVRILVKDKQLVEYGQTLMLVEENV